MTLEKNRHGCLTAWLILVIIVNSLLTLILLVVDRDTFREALPDAPGWAIPVSIMLTVSAVACAIAIFYWKKWGFWGLLAVYTADIVVGLAIGTSIGEVLLGMIGLSILYGVLQLGQPKSGWSQLE